MRIPETIRIGDVGPLRVEVQSDEYGQSMAMLGPSWPDPNAKESRYSLNAYELRALAALAEATARELDRRVARRET